MRTKLVDEPLHLNLYNFENGAAKASPYVLTSPRSLEACRKAGCKPVELLHKSIEEYREDLGALASADVYRLYENEETHRLNKLETCRAIRRELMTQSGTSLLYTDVTHLPIKQHNKQHRPFDVSVRKDLLNKENFATASIKSTVNSDFFKGQQNTGKADKCYDSDSALNETPTSSPLLYLTGGGEESICTNSVRKQPSTVLLRSSFAPKHVSHGSGLNRKTILDAKGPPTPTSSSSWITSLSSNCSTASSVNQRKQLRAKDHTRSVHPRVLRTGCKSLPSSANIRKRHKGSSLLSLSENSKNYDSNNNSHRESHLSTTSGVISRRKHVSFGHFHPDDLGLSEHDCRILELMAFKKELERESDEFAHQAHILWEQDREIREQVTQEHAQKWKEYVAEKRRIENVENARKWEEMKQSLRRSQQLLEQSIHEKEELATRRKKLIDEKKLCAAGERSVVAAKRRADVEAAQQLLDLETALWQHSVEEQQKGRLDRAENTRLLFKETYRRRVASTNRVEELRHQERWIQVKEETQAALQALRQLCRQREKRAQERYGQLLQDRDRHIKSQSLERAIRFQQVRELHDELEEGLWKWQEQVLQLQWRATQRAQSNATRHLDTKRQRIQMENRARIQHHSKLMERICREDEARARYIREMIAHKEAKMKRMAHERDLALQESRLQAQTTAHLREHLRRTLSPETFDRKVARVALEMRVAGRPPTASPTMTHSHIFLG